MRGQLFLSFTFTAKIGRADFRKRPKLNSNISTRPTSLQSKQPSPWRESNPPFFFFLKTPIHYS